MVRHKRHRCAGTIRFANLHQLRRLHAPLKPLMINSAVSLHLDFQPLRKRIYTRNPHPVQSPRNLIRIRIKLTARMQHRQHHCHRRLLFRRMHIHRNPATVINHRKRTILIDPYFYVRAVARQCLINRVIHHLVDTVVIAPHPRIPDIHRRSFPHRIDTLQYRNVIRPVLFRIWVFCRCISPDIFRPLFVLIARHNDPSRSS